MPRFTPCTAIGSNVLLLDFIDVLVRLNVAEELKGDLVAFSFGFRERLMDAAIASRIAFPVRLAQQNVGYVSLVVASWPLSSSLCLAHIAPYKQTAWLMNLPHVDERRSLVQRMGQYLEAHL